MNFAWPHLLWLGLVPLGFLIWEIARRRRAAVAPRHPKILRAEAGARGLAFVSSNQPIAAGRRVRPWLCVGLVLGIVALARPQWGRLEEPVFDQSREIILAIDLSRSMLAEDVKPARLARAKLLIQSLLEKLAGERVGLIVFSGTAFLQSPLSSDYEILREFLPSLDPEFLPQGGSNYGALLDAAVQAFTTSNAADRFLLVLSDGEATDDEWKLRVEELKKKNIRVIGLGVGTSSGAMIPDGAGGFVKDERGAVVLSKLESDTLQQLARDTGGVYRDASNWIDLPALLKETVEAGKQGKFIEKNTVRFVERYQWPLAFGLWCLMASLCFEFPVRPRPREITLRPPGAKEPGAGGKEQEKKIPAAVASLLLLLAPSTLFLATPSARAAATIAKPAEPPELSPLGRMVARLAEAKVRTARDWAELGRETVTWGGKLQSEQQPVPEGPVRDALAAVGLGEKLDPKTADWPKLREELEALLKKPEEQKQDQQDQDKDQDKQDKDKKEQNQDQKGEKNQDQNSQQSQNPSEKNNDQQKKNQPFDQNTKPPEEKEPKPGESAFGDMKKQDTPPPPPPGDTQKVGGAPEKKDLPPEASDPALALPLQELDQLRNQDSPARLFELMEGERKPQKKTGKDW
jgi:Ca-activated chloride channel family protein